MFQLKSISDSRNRKGFPNSQIDDKAGKQIEIIQAFYKNYDTPNKFLSLLQSTGMLKFTFRMGTIKSLDKGYDL